MNDYLIKATAYNHQVRAFAIQMSETINEVRLRHNLNTLAADAIGRAMTATVLLNSSFKGSEQLTVTISGGGIIGSLLVDAKSNGCVRGYVTNQHVLKEDELKTLTINDIVGSTGTMSVMRQKGRSTPFIGQIPIISGNINDEFDYYLNQSEQIPSNIHVGTVLNKDQTVAYAGGFMIQLLPGTDSHIFAEITELVKRASPLDQMMAEKMSPELMLSAIFGENMQQMDKLPIRFQCECSRERIQNAIISLGKGEILDMIETDGSANAECHFCNEHYFFSKDDLLALLPYAK